MNIKYLVVSAPISQPLSQPGRRSTIPHDTTVGASEAGVLDHPEVRRCWSAAPSTPPNAPVQKARTVNAWKRSALYHLRSRRGGGRRHALLRERRFTRLHQDGASFPKSWSGHESFYRCRAPCRCCWVAECGTTNISRCCAVAVCV